MIPGLRRTSLLPLRRILTPTLRPTSRIQIPRYYGAMSDIKTLPVLDDKDLADGEHKAVDFDGTKILLSRVKGEVVSCSGWGSALTAARDVRALHTCEWPCGGKC